ncbi:glycoside hydrolase [Methylobacterium sp. WL9]|uniref:glycoside hydrolase n=1 Tax=Methylobacterium sp. WL9 TaxID=2603898 RepID=UPI0011C70B24|nr:glycoside hydrolase [Methylobacterium sp. WL9]TXN23985.1 glycoside hydrolase [Methylobacterium sp. WL9]
MQHIECLQPKAVCPAAYVSALQGQPNTVEKHCWEWVRLFQRDLLDRNLPPVLISDRLNARELVKAFHAHPERKRWRQTPAPAHGAIVLMHRPGSHARAIHAGVYLDLDGGGVLHADEDAGVTFDDPASLNLRNWRTEFYVPA